MTETIAESRKRRLSVLGRVLLFWTGYLFILWLASNPKAMVPEQWGQLTWGLTSSALLLPLTLLFLRWEGHTLRDVGLDFNVMSIPRVVVGTLIGLAIFGLVILLIALAAGSGAVQFELNAGLQLGPILGIIATTFALSCMEELGFRGYPLRTLVSNLGMWPAQGIVAVAFGLTHIAYGWPWTAVILGVVPSALLFGMAATASRGLAVPIGVHAGVNLAEWFIGGDRANALGIWTLIVKEEAQSRVATMSPIISITVVFLATAAFWYWQRSHHAYEDR